MCPHKDNSKFYKNTGLLLIFYLISQGGILFIPNAIFWDDWLIYRVDPSIILEKFDQMGSLFNIFGHLHVALLAVGPWIYKISTFIMGFGSALILNEIIKRYKKIDSCTRFFIVLLFMVLPFNMARVALIDFPYTFSYFLFFLAWLLMGKYRVTSLLIFFISFNTNSLLVFYAIPFSDFFLRKCKSYNPLNIFSFLLRNLDYFFIPFIYFLIKVNFYKPHGIYSGYNENFSIKNLKISAIASYDELHTYIHHIDLFINVTNLLTSLTLIILTYVILRINKIHSIDIAKRTTFFGLCLGLLITCIGLFPYWILANVPTFNQWSSRHQLLSPLGASIFFTMLGGIFKRNIWFFAILIGLSMSFTLTSYKNLYFDWEKQKQLIKLFSNEPLIEAANLILVDDQTDDNALYRTYRFYEWNGLLEMAFGDQKRFALNISDTNLYRNFESSIFTEHYKAKLHTRNPENKPLKIKVTKTNSDSAFSILPPIYVLTISEN